MCNIVKESMNCLRKVIIIQKKLLFHSNMLLEKEGRVLVVALLSTFDMYLTCGYYLLALEDVTDHLRRGSNHLEFLSVLWHNSPASHDYQEVTDVRDVRNTPQGVIHHDLLQKCGKFRHTDNKLSRDGLCLESMHVVLLTICGTQQQKLFRYYFMHKSNNAPAAFTCCTTPNGN